MNFKEKLKRLATAKEKSPSSTKDYSSLAEILGGSQVSTPFGDYHLVVTRFSLEHLHGDYPLGDVLTTQPELIGFIGKDMALEEVDLTDALFIDTETTGLAGGTGTYPFLVGAGRFCGNQFVVKQFLMRDYPEELALLHALRSDLNTASSLVSFNGKCFDWPLLRDRFTLARFEHQFDLPHLDLLHFARRFWKDAIVSCSLNSLERHFLGVVRQEDVPGSEVPQRYFDFLATGRAELLKDVFHHNLLDILSLATLTLVLAKRGEQAPNECQCPFEAEAIGKLHADNGNLAVATRYYQAALALANKRGLKARILKKLAFSYKRLGQDDAAAQLWLTHLELVEDLICYEELAKYYEHRTGNMEQALLMARRGLAQALRTNPSRVKGFQHRLARLEKRIRRESARLWTG